MARPRGCVESVESGESRAAAHPDVREAMGDAGRARILDGFSVDMMVRKTLRVYAEAIHG